MAYPDYLRKVPITPGLYRPTNQELAKVFWLIQRHTSVTFIQRITDMLEKFTEGFAPYVAKYDDPGRRLDQLIGLKSDVNDLKQGLIRLRKGDTSGYRDILQARSFETPFISRAYEEGWYNLGFPEPGGSTISRALWCWMETLTPMFVQTILTLTCDYWYPGMNGGGFIIPERIAGFPAFDLGGPIATGKSVPVSGVYMPTTPGGCPNYLIKGFKAPHLCLPTVRIDRLEHSEEIEPDDPPDYPYKHYPYKEGWLWETDKFPTTWVLRWEDDRWRDGREPLGEYEYLLDPKTHFPTEPPVALRDPENPQKY